MKPDGSWKHVRSVGAAMSIAVFALFALYAPTGAPGHETTGAEGASRATQAPSTTTVGTTSTVMTPSLSTSATPAPAITSTTPAGIPQPPVQLASAVKDAASTAASQGARVGIVVADTATGQGAVGGNYDGLFLSQSTIKVLIAARLLVEGKMAGHEDLATSMITRSDDAAADYLYDLSGGDSLLPWANSYYKTTVGQPPVNAGWWGMSRVSPAGVATALRSIYADPKTGNWLSTNMSRMAPVAVDGTNQVFGLKAVDPQAWVKQGWGGDMDATLVGTPSVGFVANGRYVVAIYAEAPSSYSQLMSVVTAASKTSLAPVL